MTQDRIAKNLLENKTCNNCKHYHEDDVEKTKDCEFWKLPIPAENTCEKWEEAPFVFGPKILLPIIRTTFPSLIAKELISVQPMWENNSRKPIFYLKYKGRFKAKLKRVLFAPCRVFSSFQITLSWRRIVFIVTQIRKWITGAP
jgi:hypothetical protein